MRTPAVSSQIDVLRRRELEVDRDRHGAGPDDTEQDFGEADVVLEDHEDALEPLDSERDQSISDPIDALLELCIRHRPLALDKGDSLRVSG